MSYYGDKLRVLRAGYASPTARGLLDVRDEDEERRNSFERTARQRVPAGQAPKMPSPKPSSNSLADRADERSILQKTGDVALDGVGALGNFLDVPGSVVRDVLTFLPGGPAPANPLDQLLPWNWTKSRGRTTGQDFMEDYGLMDQNTNPFAKFAGGLVFEVATDPVTYLSGGLSSAIKGGGKGAIAARALKKQGILDRVDTYVKSGVGKREALQTSSTRDVIKSEPLVKAARTTEEADAIRRATESSIDNAIRADKSFKKQAANLTKEKADELVEEIKDSKLADSYYRFKAPGLPEVKFGGTKRARFQDELGKKVRYSGPVVSAMSKVSKRNENLTTAQSQIAAREFAPELEGATALARSKMYPNIKELDSILNDFDGLTGEDFINAQNEVGMQMLKYLEDISRERVPGVDLETGLDLTDEAGMSIPKMVFEESRDELFKESRDEFRERFLKELAEAVTDPSKPNVTETVYNKVAQALAPRQGGPPVMTLGTDGVAREAPGMSSSILDDIKDQMDELAVSAKQYGDFTSLTDEFATYYPRRRQTSRGTISGADRSKAFDPENPFALKRDDKYRGIPGGTSAINRMSIDQRFAGITSKKALNATKQNSDEYMNKFSLFKREYASDLAGAKEGKAKDLFDAIASRDLDDVKRGVTLFSVDPGGSALRAMESAYRTRVQADMIRDAVRQVMDVESVPSGRMSTSVRTLGGAFTDELAEETASVVGMAESLGSKLAAARGVPEESVSKKFRFEGPDDLGSGPRDPVPTEPSSSGPTPTGRTPDQQPTQPSKQVDTDVTQQQPASGQGGDQPVTSLETSQASVDARDPLWGLINSDLDTLLKGITSRTKEEFIDEAGQLGRQNLKLLTKQVDPKIKVSGAGRTASVVAGDVYDTAKGILSKTKKAPVEETSKVPVGAIDPASLMESLDPNQELLFRATGFLKSNVDPKSPFMIRIPDSMISDLSDAGYFKVKPIEDSVAKSQINQIAEFSKQHTNQSSGRPAEIVRNQATEDNLYILRDQLATVSVPSYFIDTVRSLHGDDVEFYLTKVSLGNRSKRVFAAVKGEQGRDVIASAYVKPVKSAEDAFGSPKPKPTKSPVASKEVDLFDGDKILQSAFDDHRRFVDSLPTGIPESNRAEMIGVRDLHKYPVQLRDQAVRYLAENKPEYLDALKKKLNKTNDDKSLQLLESIKRATSAPDGSALKAVSAKVRVDAPNRSRVMFGLSRVFGDEEAATTLAVFDATAKAYARATSRSADEFYASIDNIAEVSSLGANAPDNARGSIIFHKNGQASIFGSKSADISTSIHEMTHYARRILADVDSEFARLVDAAVGSNAGRLSVEQEELFARGFETFLSEGKAPVPELDSIYAKIKQWITDVYKGLKGTPLEEKITPELRSAYQRMQGVVEEVPTKPNAKKGKGVVDKSSSKKSGKGRSQKKAPKKYSGRHQRIADAIEVDASSLSQRQLKDIELALEAASQVLDEQINPDSILINLFGGRQIEVKDTSNKKRVKQAYDIPRENVAKAVIKAHEMNEQGLDYSNWKGFDEIADLAYAESGEAGYFIAKDGTYDLDQIDNAEKLWNLLLSKEVKKKKSGNRYVSLNPSKKLSIYDQRVVAMAEEMGLINPILEPPTYNQTVKRKPSPWDDPYSFGPELERFDPETGEELFQSSRGVRKETPGPDLFSKTKSIANRTKAQSIKGASWDDVSVSTSFNQADDVPDVFGDQRMNQMLAHSASKPDELKSQYDWWLVTRADGTHSLPFKTWLQSDLSAEYNDFVSVGDIKNSEWIAANGIPSDEFLMSSMPSKNAEKIASNRLSDLNGKKAFLRIDIPTYTSTGQYAVTTHLSRPPSGSHTYSGVARLSGPVRFLSDEKRASKIGRGDVAKSPMASIEGTIFSSPEANVIPSNIDDWTPVGYNPAKSPFFYDKRTGREIKGGQNAISVGNTVYVEKVAPSDYGTRNANLSPTQSFAYKKTRSKNFRSWFGNSKAVDAKGNPATLYHGTNVSFNEFMPSDSGEFGPGIYMTTSPNEANKYAGAGTGARVMPVYTRMNNPFVANDPSEVWDLVASTGNPNANPSEVLSAMGYDGIVVSRPVQIYDEASRRVVDTAEMQKHYVAFDPKQIKSATGNTGTFDESSNVLFQSSRGRVEENVVNEAGEAVLSASMPGRRFMEHEGDVVIRALQQPTPDDFARVIGKVYSDHILDIAPQLEDQAKALYGVRNGDWGTIHSRDGVSKTSREWLAEDFVKFARGEIKPPSGLGGYFDGMLQVVMKMIGRDGAVPVNNQIGKFLGQIMDQPFRGEVTSMAEVMRKLGDRNPTAKSRLLALFTPEEQTQAIRNALRKRVETRQARLRNGGLDELERQIEEIKIEAASMPGDEDAIKEFEALVRRKEREVKQATDLLGKTPDQWLDEYETLRMSGEKNSLDGVRFDVTDSAKVGEAKIPSWMANDLIKQNEVADQVEGLFGIGAIDEWWDKYSSVFKTSVTALHPGFHLRNFTSGFAHNAMNGVHDPRYSAYNVKRFTQPYTDGRQLMYGKQVAESNKIPGLEEMTDAQASEQLAEELFVHGVIEQPGSYRDIPGEKGASVYSQLIGPRDPSRTPDNLFGFFKSRRSPLPKPMEGVQEKGVYRSLDRMKRAWSQASETGRSIGDIVEFQHRVGGYIALRRQGYSAAAAAERINMLHVDYSNLTSFEKQKLRRLVPFYSFSRGMAKYLANELTTNPAGPVGISIRAQNRTRDRDVATPTYVSKGLSVPLGTNEDGTRHFLTGLGLMHEQPVQQLAPLLSMDPGSALFSGISNLNPLAKIPLELAFDESTFQQGVDGGVDLDDARPPVGQMLSNLADNEDGQPVRLGKTFEVLAGSSPASRYIKTVSQMSDDRKGLFGRYVAPLTGFRVTSVSPERQDAVLRERAEQYLQEVGARKFEKRYIPDEVYNAMSEEDKKIVDKYLALIEVLGKRSKERRSNQKKGLVDG